MATVCLRLLSVNFGTKLVTITARPHPTMCILDVRDASVTGFQADIRGKRRTRLTAWPVVSVVCLLLLALLTVVQVAHVHPVESDADHCPLCIVMHTAAPVAVTAAVVVLVQFESATPVFKARTVVRFWHPQLFTRPPPSSC